MKKGEETFVLHLLNPDFQEIAGQAHNDKLDYSASSNSRIITAV